MRTPAPRGRWLDTRGPLLAAVLALAVLLPAAMLFTQVWSGTGDQVAFAQKERHGIAYLAALGPVETALTDAQSSAVAGLNVDTDRLGHAVDEANRLDQRYGGQLRTHQRWSELRQQITAVTGQQAAAPTAAYTSYSQVSSLLLALYDKVRSESGLIRDPDADVYYLEDGAAQELPEGVVAAGQYGDLIEIALGQHGDDRDNTVGKIIEVRASLASNATDLTSDLQLAVDATASRSLSSNLLARLDRFRRSVDALAPDTITIQNSVSTADEVRVSSNRAAAVTSASDLSGVVLQSIDGLVVTRLNGLTGRQHLAAGLLAVIALLALSPAGLLVAARLRASRAAKRRSGSHDRTTGGEPHGPATPGRPDERGGPDEPGGPGGPGGPAGPYGVDGPGRPGHGAEPPGGSRADGWPVSAGRQPAGWERSGAAR